MSRVAVPHKSQQSSKVANVAQEKIAQQPSKVINVPHEKIAQRAYEKWVQRGRRDDTALLDWCEAETELRAEHARQQPTQSRR